MNSNSDVSAEAYSLHTCLRKRGFVGRLDKGLCWVGCRYLMAEWKARSYVFQANSKDLVPEVGFGEIAIDLLQAVSG